jgi:hypothetical protein
MPSDILDDGFLMLKNTFAAEEEESFEKIDSFTISSIEDFIELSNKYAGTYQDAIITIAPSAGLLDLTEPVTLSDGIEYSFIGLGSADYPFKGTIEYSGIVGGYITLSTSLFNYLDQSAILVDANNELQLCSKTTGEGSDFPLLAAHYVNSESTSSASDIFLKISAYKDPNTDEVSSFGGIIGVMEEGSSLNLSINTSSDKDSIKGSSDIGMFCNRMEKDTKLTISSYKVDSTPVSELSYSVTTTGEDNSAGAFVGSMAELSSLIINSEYEYKGTITGTSNAGGAVGSMGDGASVNFVNGYKISGTVKASKNSGGIAGTATNPVITIASTSNNFNLSSDAQISGGNSSGGTAGGIIGDCTYTCDKTIDISDYTFNSFTITNGKYAGGLYGSLSNTSPNGTITIKDSNYSSENYKGVLSKYSSKYNYGGLIGKYSAAQLDTTLIISEVITNSSLTANCSSYSGLISEIGNSSYVEITDVYITVNSNSKSIDYYGGVVAKAGEDIFINIGDVTVNGNYTATSASGGLVGYSTSGVIRLHGKTDLSASKPTGTTYKTGQLIGIRNNTLVYAVGDGNTVSKNNNDWYFNRCSKVYVSDIGDWGEVIRLNGIDLYESKDDNDSNALLYFDITSHVVRLKEFSEVGVIKNLNEFVAYALYFQIDNSGSFDKGSITMSADSKINLNLDSVNLSGTGLTGFTRDNVIDDNDNKAKYSGSFVSTYKDGTNIILATGETYGLRNNNAVSQDDAGSGQIYDHSYLGLFGQRTGNSQVKYITVSGSINFGLVSGNNVYAGAVTGWQSSGSNQTYSNVDVSTEIKYDGDGNKIAYVGGFVGYANYGSTINIEDSKFTGLIINNASYSEFYNAGLIGYIYNSGSGSEIQNISISNTLISGSCISVKKSDSNTGAAVGGIIASVDNNMKEKEKLNKTNIKLDEVNFDDFTIDIIDKLTSTSGGFLGYNWRNCDVTLKGIRIQNSTLSTSALFGGLVYEASGKWDVKVNKGGTVGSTDVDVYTYAGVEFGKNVEISGKSDSTNPSALMVARGDDYASKKMALYMNITSSDAYVINKNLKLTLSSNSDYFDEIVGRSITTVSSTDSAGVTMVTDSENENGIVSYSTKTSTGTDQDLKIDQDKCNTYINQIGTNYKNPNTRYYYNLNDYSIADSSITSGEEMLLWSVGQYAADNLYTNFIDNNARGKNVTISDDSENSIDLTGLSYYPISYAGHSVTIEDATITFDYEQIEGTEKAYPNKALDDESGTVSQHYMMQSGLFLDFYSTKSSSASVTIKNVTLQGTIGRINDASGAIVCGNSYGVLSDTTYKTFSFTVNGLTLNGIKVVGADSADNTDGTDSIDSTDNTDGTDSTGSSIEYVYAPLILNKVGSYSSLSITNVSVNSDEYEESKSGNSEVLDGVNDASDSGDSETLDGENVENNSENSSNDGSDTSAESSSVKVTKAASSLIGDVGSKTDVNISVLFEEMDLNGRTESSIFTRATFLNSFSYDPSDVVSSGTYNFEEPTEESTEESTAKTKITFGKEISNGVGNSIGRNPYSLGEDGVSVSSTGQTLYFGSDNVVEDGDVKADEAPGFYTDEYLRYVYKYEGEDGDYMHELDINQTVVDIISGCGTYDDPYIIDTDGQLETLGKFLTSDSITGWEINICYDIASKISTDGKTINSSASLQTDNSSHYKVISGSTWAVYDSEGNKLKDTLYSAQVRAYLRNAYYMVTTDINLRDNFYGLGGYAPQTDTFSGVIVGKADENGEFPTIHISSHINSSNTYFGGLIAYSNGSVVKDLNIDYSPAEDSSQVEENSQDDESIKEGENSQDDDNIQEVENSQDDDNIQEVENSQDDDNIQEVENSHDNDNSQAEENSQTDESNKTEIYLSYTAPSQSRENQSFFGGVIGYVVGGDNIIDNVNVYGLDELDLKIDKVSDKDATYDNTTENSKLTAIGGYVGLIGGNTLSGGGVIFRNIDPEEIEVFNSDIYTGEVISNDEDSIEGDDITNDNQDEENNDESNDSTKADADNSDAGDFENITETADSNEDNTNEGTDDTDDSNEDNTVESTDDTDDSNKSYSEFYYRNPYVGRVLDGYALAEDCSLNNTDKNYKIPTIDTSNTSANTLSVSAPNNNVSTITISTEEQLWLLSAIVNSGAGGKAKDKNTYNTDAYDYGCVRTGNYKNVGGDASDDDIYDCNYFGGISYSDNKSKKLSYLIKKYTTDDKFILSNVSTGSYGYSIIFNNDLDMSDYGNGFRGIGSGYTNNETSKALQKRSIYLSGTVGNNTANVNITINRNVYEYSFEELQVDGGGWWTQSIGLFPALNFYGDTTFQYITITGNVKINYTGNDEYIGEASAGGLAGVTANGSDKKNVTFKNVNTSYLTVSGAKYSGGLVGDYGQGSRTKKRNGSTAGSIAAFGTVVGNIVINNCNYDNLIVVGGYTAGGYFGVCKNEGYTTTITGSCSYKISHIKWNKDACKETYAQIQDGTSTAVTNSKEKGFSGGGGLFGYYSAGDLNINNGDAYKDNSSYTLTFDNVKVSGPQFAYNCDYGLGLISGLQNAGTLYANNIKANSCKVYIDIESTWSNQNATYEQNQYVTPAAGIFVGYSNQSLNYYNCNIDGCELRNSGMIGCYGGSVRSTKTITIKDSTVNNTLVYSIGAVCYNGTSQVGGLCGGTKGTINVSGVTMTDDYVVSDGKTGLIMGFANGSNTAQMNVENFYASGCSVATTREPTAKIILGSGTDPDKRDTYSTGTDNAAGSAAILIGSVVDNNGASSMNNTSLKYGSVFNMSVTNCVIGYYCKNSSDPLYWDTPTDTIKNQATADYIGVYTGTNTGKTYTTLYNTDNTLSNVKGYTGGNFGKLIGSASGITKLYAIGISIQGKYYPYYENGYGDKNVGINSGSDSYIIYADYLGKSDADKTKTNIYGTINADYTQYTAAISPYVVVNPFNQFIVYKNEGNAKSNTYKDKIYLTGDGFSKSAIEAIIDDLTTNGTNHTENLKYNQVADIAKKFPGSNKDSNNSATDSSDDNVTEVSTSDSSQTTTDMIYKSKLIDYLTASESDESDFIKTNESNLSDDDKKAIKDLLNNFDVLLIDTNNTEEITTMIYAYISLLTNSVQTSTQYYYSGITIQTYAWNDTYNSFIALSDSSENSLIYENGTFKLNGAKHDNQLRKFTLIDVQYQNKKSDSQYYHLYIPVVVKKVLEFDFSVNMNIGSSTYKADYSKNTSVLASYGDTFTAQLSYNYTWTKEEWNTYLTSGSSLLWSYDKQVKLGENPVYLIEDSTRITLVDSNRYGSGYTYFYTDGSKLTKQYDSNGDVSAASLDFSVLKDKDKNGFTSVFICDLLDLKVIEDDASGLFKKIDAVENATSLKDKYPNATVRVWNQNEFIYYGMATDDDRKDSNAKFYTISSSETQKYKDGADVTISEIYYLILNCKVGNGVYTRSIELGADKLTSSDADFIPTRKKTLSIEEKQSRSSTQYYTLGNFFELKNYKMNTESENKTNVIVDGTNDYIDVTTSVELSGLSDDEDYIKTFNTYASKKNAYFRFKISLSDENGETISINPNFISVEKLTVGSRNIIESGEKVNDSSLESSSNSICYSAEIINGICYVTIAGLTAENYMNQKVEAEICFDYEGAVGKISDQFPERLSESSKEGVAFSAVASIAYSKNSLDGTKMSSGPFSDNEYYYREKIELVELTYNSYNTVSVDGNTSQLGINGREVESDKGQTITSLGSFNAKNLTSLELTDTQSERYPAKIVYKLTLEKKVDGDSGSEYKQVDISDYINSIVATYEEQSMDGREEKDVTTEIKASTFSFELSENTIKNLSSDEIEVNISFFVKSDFSEAELEDLGDDAYSNYRIKLSAYLVNGNGTRITDEVSDYFVYTNAKFYLGIIGVNDFDASSDTN